jgi:hypothetical protein
VPSWTAGDDDIETDLARKRATVCPRCPAQVWCYGGVWPDSIVYCRKCATILQAGLPFKRLVVCGGSTIPSQNRLEFVNACNCPRHHLAYEGYKGMDKLVEDT